MVSVRKQFARMKTNKDILGYFQGKRVKGRRENFFRNFLFEETVCNIS